MRRCRHVRSSWYCNCECVSYHFNWNSKERERETQVLLKTTIKVAKPVPVTVTVDDCGWLWHVCCPCGILWSREVMALAQTRVQTKACAVTSFNIFQHLSTGRNMQWSDDIRWYQMISDVLDVFPCTCNSHTFEGGRGPIFHHCPALKGKHHVLSNEFMRPFPADYSDCSDCSGLFLLGRSVSCIVKMSITHLKYLTICFMVLLAHAGTLQYAAAVLRLWPLVVSLCHCWAFVSP